jgi:hypothetical protein
MYTPIDWWIDYSVWLMLQFKFMAPAKLIAYNDDMETYLKTFSLNGVRASNLCKPYRT